MLNASTNGWLWVGCPVIDRPSILEKINKGGLVNKSRIKEIAATSCKPSLQAAPQLPGSTRSVRGRGTHTENTSSDHCRRVAVSFVTTQKSATEFLFLITFLLWKKTRRGRSPEMESSSCHGDTRRNHGRSGGGSGGSTSKQGVFTAECSHQFHSRGFSDSGSAPNGRPPSSARWRELPSLRTTNSLPRQLLQLPAASATPAS